MGGGTEPQTQSSAAQQPCYLLTPPDKLAGNSLWKLRVRKKVDSLTERILTTTLLGGYYLKLPSTHEKAEPREVLETVWSFTQFPVTEPMTRPRQCTPST